MKIKLFLTLIIACVFNNVVYSQCKTKERKLTFKVLDIYETKKYYWFLGASDTMLVMIISFKDSIPRENDRCRKIKIGETYEMVYSRHIPVFTKYSLLRNDVACIGHKQYLAFWCTQLDLCDPRQYKKIEKKIKRNGFNDETFRCWAPDCINCVYLVTSIKGLLLCE